MPTSTNRLLYPMRRLGLAIKFYIRLGYSWNLAWVKAERRA